MGQTNKKTNYVAGGILGKEKRYREAQARTTSEDSLYAR